MAAEASTRGVPIMPAAANAFSSNFRARWAAVQSSKVFFVGAGCNSKRTLCRSRRGLCYTTASLSSEAGKEQDGKQAASSSSSSIDGREGRSRSTPPPVKNEFNEAVKKTAATFAPRASVASKNPAPPGSTLYKVFQAQAYFAMIAGGALSFNLLFPSDHPDVWRLMGMWSVWMFTVPSLRARDCSKKEKDALNYLFLAIPLINVTLPLVWKSFAAVWSADVFAFFAIYAWKMEWLSEANNMEDS